MSEVTKMNGQDEVRNAYLHAMGITEWVPRASDVSINGALPSESGPVDWQTLEGQVASCTLCGLHESRTQTVFGAGSRQADWLIIGEAPGADEDREGEPFVGSAGKLLNEMLHASGYRREDVYIANILKCHPPNNRNPRSEEVKCCHGYLQQQIDLVQPRIILTVGGIAAHNLLATDAPVGKLRGVLHHYGDRKIPLVVTYHPAYLLRSPLEKRKVWTDLKFARHVLDTLDREI